QETRRGGASLSGGPQKPAVPALEPILSREPGPLGVRRYPTQRSKLRREAVTVQTPWGAVRGKRGWRECGPEVFSPEYEDCARVAREHAVPLREVYAAVKEAFKKEN